MIIELLSNQINDTIVFMYDMKEKKEKCNVHVGREREMIKGGKYYNKLFFRSRDGLQQ